MELKETTKQYKIYGLIIEVRDTVFLSVQYASCLEEAFAQAKLEFQKVNPLLRSKVSINGAKIGLFTIKSVQELSEENFNFNINREAYDKIEQEEMKKSSNNSVKSPSIEKFLKPKEVMEKIAQLANGQNQDIENKNKLMKLIISQKNKELFEKNKSIFTANETQYLLEHLN